jgi:hypothetical protein
MTLEIYRRYAATIGYGKVLPEAVYVVRPQQENVPVELWKIICRAEIAARPDPSWNLLKIHTREVAMTFLMYPEFEVEPHPALAEATKINLNTGSIVRTDFRQRANPPILHRKETFLPPDDERVPGYAALTKREEDAGLYRDLSRIGFRMHWLALLRRSDLAYDGHTLVSRHELSPESDSENGNKPNVARHRTAIKRYNFSKPVKQLLERGLLRKKDRFFDYGCGHGMDIEALENLGYKAAGWDPAFRPAAEKTPAAVVNLSYVLNVIEEPTELLPRNSTYKARKIAEREERMK